MEWVLVVVALLFIVTGVGEILYTDEIRKGLSALMKDSHRKPLAVGAAVGAFCCCWPWAAVATVGSWGF